MSAAASAVESAPVESGVIGVMGGEVRAARVTRVPPQYGGQAVVEGVMMRGRRAMAVAVRRPSGGVAVHSEALDGLAYRSAWAKWPFIRGVLMLGHGLTLGMRALVYSANVAIGDDQSAVSREHAPSHAAVSEELESVARQAFHGPLMWGTLGVSLVFALGLFFVLPVLLSRLVEPLLPRGVLVALSEGMIRVGLLLAYLWLIGRVPKVGRLFAYHGAEHKAINAFEAGEPLCGDRVGRYSVAHPRCGTTFVLYVVVVSAVVFSLLGQPALPMRIAMRIVFVPLIASVAYEALRFSGRRRFQPVMGVLLLPGLALQALTTREPDPAQVEVAIAALERVIALDRAAESGE